MKQHTTSQTSVGQDVILCQSALLLIDPGIGKKKKRVFFLSYSANFKYKSIIRLYGPGNHKTVIFFPKTSCFDPAQTRE